MRGVSTIVCRTFRGMALTAVPKLEEFVLLFGG